MLMIVYQASLTFINYMKRLYKYLLIVLSFSMFGYQATAQRTGINKVPETTLDVKGGINADSGLSVKPYSIIAGAIIEADAAVSLIHITDDGAAAANSLNLTGTATEGQMLLIFNQDAQAVSFGSFGIAAGEALHLVYVSGSWKQLSTRGLTHFTESQTFVDSASVFSPSNGQNQGIILQPLGTGYLSANQPDNGITGGNARGSYAIDWQIVRNDAAQVASGNYAFIGGGRRNAASGLYSSVSGGQSNIASSDYSFVAGGFSNTASGRYSSVAGGLDNTAASYAETVLGSYAKSIAANDVNTFNSYDYVLRIGNGTGTSARSDAFQVKKDGTTTIYGGLELVSNNITNSLIPNSDGTVSIDIDGTNRDFVLDVNGASDEPTLRPSTTNWGYIGTASHYMYQVHTSRIYRNNEYSLSDSTVKKDIEPLQSGLASLMQLKPKTYYLNPETHPALKDSKSRHDETGKVTEEEEDSRRHLGFLAQELQQVLPEMVTYDSTRGLYMVRNYEQLSAVIVAAVQEQQSELSMVNDKLIMSDAALKEHKADLSEVKTQNAELKTQSEAMQATLQNLLKRIEKMEAAAE